MQLAVMRDDHVRQLMELIGHGHLNADPRFATRETRVAATAFIRPIVEAELRKRTTAEWQTIFNPVGLPCAPVLDLPEALTQPQVRHRGLVEESVDERTGSTMRRLNAPFQYAHDGPRASGPPPRLGEHTDAVLATLGYSDQDIAALRRDGVI